MVGTHHASRRHEQIKGGSDRAFGVVFSVVFAITSFWPLLDGGSVRLWALSSAGGFLVIALAMPKMLAPLNRLWTKFGLLLSRFVSPVAMGIVYFLAVVPIGVLMRSLGKDPLKLKLSPEADTYWEMRNPPGPPPETMKDQF